MMCLYTITMLITDLALLNNFPVDTALRIAHCESTTGTNLFNPNSSAKGIYQFVDRTWENYCQGNVLNHYDNVQCFMELYEKNKHWWECR